MCTCNPRRVCHDGQDGGLDQLQLVLGFKSLLSAYQRIELCSGSHRFGLGGFAVLNAVQSLVNDDSKVLGLLSPVELSSL